MSIERRGLRRLARSGISCLLLLGAVLAAPAAEQSAIEDPDIAKPILEAQKLAKKKQWDAALSALEKAQRVPDKSPYAAYKIDEFLAYILTQQRKYTEAAKVFERMIASGQAPASKLDDYAKTVARLYFSTKQYPQAIRYAQLGLKHQPGDVELLELAGQAQYLTKDYKDAAASMGRLVDATERAGRKPEESWLQIMLNSHHELGNESGRVETLEQLLRYHPKQDYWERLFAHKDVRNLPPALRLGYYRLMFDVGVLRSPSDIEEMALSAVDAGTPAEAVRVLEWAFSNNVIAESGKARFQRMLDFAKQRADASAASLAELSENARRAKSGEPDAVVGRAYLGAGEYQKAITAFQRAVKEGALEDPDRTRTNLAIAYLKAGQVEPAWNTLQQIDPGSPWRELGDLWALRHRSRES